ncbi:scat [Symbiodinium microadriaticum]|nr:scat [Symbiodinium microadriaticum]
MATTAAGYQVEFSLARLDEESAAQEAHLSVPLDYFSDSFSLEQHQIFRQQEPQGRVTESVDGRTIDGMRPLESTVDMQENLI